MVVYVIPTYYGWQPCYSAAALTDKYIEVQPDGSTAAIESRWTNAGKEYARTELGR